MEIVENRMNSRVNLMTDKCAFYGLEQHGKIVLMTYYFSYFIIYIFTGNDSLHKPNPWEYLINKKYRLVWCNVFKVNIK